MNFVQVLNFALKVGIKLQRLPLSEEVSKILDDHGCQYIQDLLALPMDKTNFNALEEILKCIEEMDRFNQRPAPHGRDRLYRIGRL